MITPLNDNVLLKEISKANPEGFIIPEEEDTNYINKGEVVVGSGYVSAGAKVLFRRPLFDEVELEGQKFLVGKFDGLIGVLND